MRGEHEDATLRPIAHFADARSSTSPRVRLETVRGRARAFREEMLSRSAVRSFRSFGLVRVPYPRRFALREACTAPVPFVHILNRMFVVRFEAPEGLKTLLVSPSDVEANRETPFFKRLSERYSFLGLRLDSLLAPVLGTVESCLQAAGVSPEEVDYVTYDHLHTQDLRRWFGADGRPGFFPRAKLLVMRQEWESAHSVLPLQADWYCPGGIHGIPADRVVLLDGDTWLGESVALVRTPGHTEGNHSIVVHAGDELFVSSENGVSADCYSPERSRIPGLRRYARDTGLEVVLNGNTLESSNDQYISMVQEKEIAGRSRRNPDFHNVMPTSELTPYWLFPGIRPSFAFGEVDLS